jgi:hypothetical protein
VSFEVADSFVLKLRTEWSLASKVVATAVSRQKMNLYFIEFSSYLFVLSSFARSESVEPTTLHFPRKIMKSELLIRLRLPTSCSRPVNFDHHRIGMRNLLACFP